jgi:hypothetical protein
MVVFVIAASTPCELVTVRLQIFKTIAWMVSRRGYDMLHAPMARMAAHTAATPEGDSSGAAASAAAVPARVSPRALPTLREPDGSPVGVRSSHPELAGCTWCHDYCYDHLIEWVLQGRAYLAPWEPRVTQSAGTGMTSAENAVNAVYEGPPRRQTDFHIASTAASLLRLFYHAGLSGVAPPAAVVRSVWSGRVAAGEALPDEVLVVVPAQLVPASERTAMWLTEPLITVALLLAAVTFIATVAICSAHGAGPAPGRRRGCWPPCCKLGGTPAFRPRPRGTAGQLPLAAAGGGGGSRHTPTAAGSWLHGSVAMPAWLRRQREKRA